MPKTNDPYSRPINATRPEGQMLQGEYYGEHATDKALHRGTGGRPVHQLRPMVSVVPAWPDDKPAEPEARPKARKSRQKESDIPAPATEATSTTEGGVTEDDLFG